MIGEETNIIEMDIDRLIEIEARTRPATQEVFQTVNEVLEKHDLSLEESLCMIAHLSGNIIHTVQRECPDATSKDAVEDRFHEVLDYYLAAYDRMEINREMKKMMS